MAQRKEQSKSLDISPDASGYGAQVQSTQMDGAAQKAFSLHPEELQNTIIGTEVGGGNMSCRRHRHVALTYGTL